MIWIFKALSKWREILIGLLAFLQIVCLALLNHKVGQIEKYIHAEIVLQAENAKAKADSAIKEKQWAEQQLKAEQNYNAKIKQIESDSRLANAGANSLSKQLKIASSRLSSAAKETIISYSESTNKLLENCTAEYIWMAERVDAERLIEAWPSE